MGVPLSNILDAVRELMQTNDEVLLVKRIKDVISYPMARMLHNRDWNENDVHAVQNPKWFFCGLLGHRLARMCTGKRLRNFRIAFSILQIKRSCPKVPTSFIQYTLEKHAKVLSSDFPIRMQAQEDYDEVLDVIQKLAGQFWDRVLPKGVEKRAIHRNLCVASTGAAYGYSRTRGGQSEAISDIAYENKLGESIMMIERFPGEVVELRCEGRGITQKDRGALIEQALRPMDDTKSPNINYYKSRNVDVYPICEPLKVRVITKGQPLTYFLSQGLQRLMHRSLKKLPCFALIGRPLQVSDLNFLKRFPNEGEYLVSGDYSGATDGQNIDYTRIIFEELLKRLPTTEEEREIYRSVLYEQFLHYPEKVDGVSIKKIDPVMQTNGQLMGSNLSFPILVATNFIVYWYSRLLDNAGNYPLNRALSTVLINGDDIAFPSTQRFYQIWKRETSRAGYELSLGKNYTDKNFIVINSEPHLYDGSSFQPIHWINTGFLTGQSKLTGRKEIQRSPISVYYNGLLHGFTGDEAIRLHYRFFHYNKTWIQEVTNHGFYQLFTPRTLGGLGCHLIKELRDKVYATRVQHGIANMCWKSRKILHNPLDEKLFRSKRSSGEKNMVLLGPDPKYRLTFTGEEQIRVREVKSLLLPSVGELDEDYDRKLLTKKGFKALFASTFHVNNRTLRAYEGLWTSEDAVCSSVASASEPLEPFERFIL